MVIDRSYAVIHLDHLLHNYQEAKRLAKDASVLAVVKANAYGHGSVVCAKHLEANGCRFFAVACLQEAIELREAGITSDILIFGRTDPKNAQALIKYNLVQTIDSLHYTNALNQMVKKPIRVHVNIDTGMSRFGLYLHRLNEVNSVIESLKKIQSLPWIAYEGIYTHFANSDESNRSFCNDQFHRFQALIGQMKKEHVFVGIKHVANSGAIISHPKKMLDMVRFGIGLYGYPHTREHVNLLPVMEVFAKVTSTRIVLEGDTISYGRTYQVKNKERIATVAIGYADGYLRALSNRDYLLYKETKLPVIGRVCMDAIMVKTEQLNLQDGDVLEVFGMHKPLEHMCQLVDTIPYEFLCNVSKRVKRIYKKNGEIVS